MCNTIYSDIITVTSRKLCHRPFEEQIIRVCSKHSKAIILREKDLTEKEYEQLAQNILSICRQYDTELILHFYPKVAQKLSIKRIHLPLWKLEELSEKDRSYFDTIGVSTHSVEEALTAQKLGATYITAGHIFTTDCKKGLPPRGLDFLKNICQTVSIPVYGIGGIHIDPKQIQAVKEYGAKGVCIMSEMMSI